MGNTLCTAQTDSYEDYYNIFPTDSVVITIPKYANSFFYTKLPDPLKGQTDQDLSDDTKFTIRYKPNPGFVGRDTFQIVYFLPNPVNGELAKKSKKVVVKTSSFILNDDTYSFYTTDSNKVLDVLSNDNIPGGNVEIKFLPTPSSSKLKISGDKQTVIFESCNSAVSEELKYIVSNGTSQEIGRIRITVKDTSNVATNKVFTKFLVKNSTSDFNHPYTYRSTILDPSHGSLTVLNDEITYRPDSAWVGVDTVTINVGTENNNSLHTFYFKVFDFDQPNMLAFDDYFYTLKNQFVSINVLKNDFTTALEVEIFEAPEHGTLLKQGNGIYKYTPDLGFSGTDVIIYKACDLASNVCEYAAATITISDFATDNVSYLSTAKNNHIFVKYPFPVNGYKLTSIPDYPDHGIADIDFQKDLMYSPSLDFVGLDSMKIKYTLTSNPSIFFTIRLYINVYDVVSNCHENCVWPGDHNNDGRVDMKDLTFIAPFVGETGTARTNPVNDYWIGQGAQDWDASKDNINLKYGDSDGNGLISTEDTTLLSVFYRNLHGIRVNKGINSLSLPFYLSSDKDYYYPGDEITINFKIGNETSPIKDLNSFTASFNFSPAFNQTELNGNFTKDHWLSDNDNMLQLVKKPFGNTVDFGSARLSGKGVAGYGDIAVIKSIIEDELEGFKDDEGIYYAQIQINDGTLTLGDGTILNTAPQTFNIPIKVERKHLSETDKQVRIYPNPTASSFEIKTKNNDNIIKSIYIYSISGQNIISLDKINQNKVGINLGNYPSGLYLVKTFTTTGVEVSKVEKL
ncbi:MAG: T9SS type A sorting domain-containing protein [Saprospiraceae bacterium]|nr:T9SS type A sorting domain-containing protein [Candidatus Brachybacter algidus]